MREKAVKENNWLGETIKIQILPLLSKVIIMTFQFKMAMCRCSPKTAKPETNINAC